MNNVNDFSTLLDGSELLEEFTILKELKTLAACLQETNKNWLQTGVYDKIKWILNKVWQKNKATVEFCPLPKAILVPMLKHFLLHGPFLLW